MDGGTPRARLARDGFVAMGPLLGASAVERLRAALAAFLPDGHRAATAYGVLRHDLVGQVPAFRALLADGRLGRIAARLLRLPEATFFQDNLVWKPPGTVGAVQWHQDFAYWPLDRPAGVTLWLALDDVDEDNGALAYLPGSHTLGERQATDFVAGSQQPLHRHLPPFDAAAVAHRAVAAPLPAGHLLAHHPLVWHTSPGNPGPRQRRAWSLTFLHPAVRWDPDHAPHPAALALQPAAGDPVVGPAYPRFRATEAPGPRPKR